MGLMHGVDLPGQIAINTEIQRGLNETRRHNQEMETQQSPIGLKESDKDIFDALTEKNIPLSREVSTLKLQHKEKKATIEKQKALLRDWMISQTAFRNLLKKYGKLPDGRSFSELSYDERVSIATAEEQHVVRTGDGIGDKQPNVKRIIMGG